MMNPAQSELERELEISKIKIQCQTCKKPMTKMVSFSHYCCHIALSFKQNEIPSLDNLCSYQTSFKFKKNNVSLFGNKENDETILSYVVQEPDAKNIGLFKKVLKQHVIAYVAPTNYSFQEFERIANKIMKLENFK